MWDLPGPGLEPVSPALAGGFLTTTPPGKPSFYLLLAGPALSLTVSPPPGQPSHCPGHSPFSEHLLVPQPPDLPSLTLLPGKMLPTHPTSGVPLPSSPANSALCVLASFLSPPLSFSYIYREVSGMNHVFVANF